MRSLLRPLSLLALLAVGAGFWQWRARTPSTGGEEEIGRSSRRTSRARSVGGSAEDIAGSILGTVNGPHGDPIQGAKVCVSPVADTEEVQTLDDERCVETGPRGDYVISSLSEGRYFVTAIAPGYLQQIYATRFRRESIALRIGSSKARADLTLEPGGVAVRGTVRDRDGSPIPFARVQKQIWDGPPGPSTISNTLGEFSLPVDPGRVSMLVQAESYASSSVFVTAPGRVEVVLLPESTIVGRVIAAESRRPLPGVRVVEDEASSTTDELGRFTLDGLAPGLHHPWIAAHEWFGDPQNPIVVGFGSTSEEVIIEAHRAFIVSGEIRIAETGEPCPEGAVGLNGRLYRRATANEGRVTFGGLPPGEYEVVHVECSGYSYPKKDEPPLIVSGNVEGLRWDVHTGLAVRGIVVDRDGEPVAGASVWSEFSATTREDGSFEATVSAPGPRNICVSTNGLNTRCEDLLVESSQEIRIVMPPAGSISGRVIDGDGHAVLGAEVELVERYADAKGRSVTNKTSQSVFTDADGEFWWREIRAGRYGLQATMYGSALRSAKAERLDVEVNEGSVTRAELVVERLTHRITGRVIDEIGAPVPDALVGASRTDWFRGAHAGQPQAIADKNGDFTIEGLGEGRYYVHAIAPDRGEGTASCESGGNVEVVLHRGTSMSGRVVTRSGHSPARASLSITGPSTRRLDVGPTGEWSVRRLSAGTYEIDVEAPEGTARKTVEVTEIEHLDDLTLELEDRAIIEGQVVDFDHGLPLSATLEAKSFARGKLGERRATLRARTNADGFFRIEDVTEGWTILKVRIAERDVSVFVFCRGGSTSQVPAIRVLRSGVSREDEDFEFAFAAPSLSRPDDSPRWVISSVDEQSPVFQAGLRPGNVVTAVNGVDVTGAGHYLLWQLLVEGDARKLTLEDGRTLILATQRRMDQRR